MLEWCNHLEVGESKKPVVEARNASSPGLRHSSGPMPPSSLCAHVQMFLRVEIHKTILSSVELSPLELLQRELADRYPPTDATNLFNFRGGLCSTDTNRYSHLTHEWLVTIRGDAVNLYEAFTGLARSLPTRAFCNPAGRVCGSHKHSVKHLAKPVNSYVSVTDRLTPLVAPGPRQRGHFGEEATE
jgi:hypothetical protein